MPGRDYTYCEVREITKKGVVVTFLVVIAVILGGFLVCNELFPAAGPIQYPSPEAVTSVRISTDSNNNGSEASPADFAEMLTHIRDSKPTRNMSVNDAPSVSPYYKIEVLTDDRMFYYYVYEENDNVYIELPYEGIYVIDRQILNIISGRA